MYVYCLRYYSCSETAPSPQTTKERIHLLGEDQYGMNKAFIYELAHLMKYFTKKYCPEHIHYPSP